MLDFIGVQVTASLFSSPWLFFIIIIWHLGRIQLRYNELSLIFTLLFIHDIEFSPLNKITNITYQTNWLILKAYQLVYGYFMLKSWGIIFIVYSHLYFLCSCFLRICFCTESNWIKNNFKQTYLTLIGTTTLSTTRPGSNLNEGELHTPQISRTGASPSDVV